MRLLRTLRAWLAPLIVLCAVCVSALLGRPAHAASDPARLRLADSAEDVDAWRSASLLFDPEGHLTIEDVSSAFDRFEVPRKRHATLGVTADPVWLRIPIAVDAESTGHWILDIDYPPLEWVDVYLLSDGRVIQRAFLGSHRPFDARPLRSRSHAVPFELRPGSHYDVVVRIRSSGSLILPLTFTTPTAFHASAAWEQMLQGVLGGLGLCLLMYSLAQWVALREPFFLKYCVLISGSLLFSLMNFGIGIQFLWKDRIGIERHAGGMAALIALVGSFLFVEQALEEPRRRQTFSRFMKGGAGFCAVVALLYAFDVLIDSHTVTTLVSVLGPVPVLMGVPGSIRRVRRGDPVGGALLVAWSIYFITTAIIIGVILGQLPANFWTMHAFQFGATFDMLAFTYVLGLRTRGIQQVAHRASVERDLMHELAMTDPLTGLTNRRGLTARLSGVGDRGGSTDLLALYWIDVDGFKAVNDRHGHDVGDALLIQIGRRLRAAVRGTDVVARLGGDEFVIVADGLQTTQRTEDVGRTLLAVADEPFALDGRTVRIGLTIGYAVAPLDTTEPARLLQLADGAMYEGKRAGKGCLRRACPDRTVAEADIQPVGRPLASALDH